MASINDAVKIGAAGFVLGLALAGPQAAGVAAADSPDTDSSTVTATDTKARVAGPRAAGKSPDRRSAAATRTAPAAHRPAAAAKDSPARAIRRAPLRAASPAPASATARMRSEKLGERLAEASSESQATVVAASVPAPAIKVSSTGCGICAKMSLSHPAPSPAIATAGTKIDGIFDRVDGLLAGLPDNGVTDLFSGALLLVRRSLLNNAPTTKPAQLAQTADTLSGTLGAVDLEGDPIVYDVLTQPSSGTVSIDPATGTYTYTPATALNTYGGADEFTVRLTDTGCHLHLFRPSETYATVAIDIAPSAMVITFPELDSAASPLAVRVDSSQLYADGIKVDAGATFTLTLPGSSSAYTWLANKPLVDITPGADNTLTIKANQAGFLGLSVQATDSSAGRYLGVYIADPATHLVPDVTPGGKKLPVGALAGLSNGDSFLEDFNFQPDRAPIDYLYIYDQGGPDSTDGNLKGLLTQAVRHGLVPVAVYYNIQSSAESADAAFQAINSADFMQRYFTKMATDFTTMNNVGVPVQVVMEPDFLSYMQTTPRTGKEQWVPDDGDRSRNTAQVSAIYTAGLLSHTTDPAFNDDLAGMVQAINYYVGKKMPNLRIGWATNTWGVSDPGNKKMGLMHVTDSGIYPWQNQTTAGKGWDLGRAFLIQQASGLADFLGKVGVTAWEGNPDRKPFLTIDKYGVDGAYPYDPDWKAGALTAVVTDLTDLISIAQSNCTSQGCDTATTMKYFGVDPETLKTMKLDSTDPNFSTAFTALQNAAKADPNIARWFFNADQWNNYLQLVKTLSTSLGGTSVMLWQIPQGHINGSTVLADRDLPNNSAWNCLAGSACGFEDSATSYFFGDEFTATDGVLAHFGANQAGDPSVKVSGTKVTWDEHMTMAASYGVMSVLFGPGLAPSTRGTPTPGRGITDSYFWRDKAAGYLSGA